MFSRMQKIMVPFMKYNLSQRRKKRCFPTPYKISLSAPSDIEREDKSELEIKARENRRNAQGSFRKLGRQIRRHVKPNIAHKSSITRVSVTDDGPVGLSKQIIGKYDLEDHLIAQNVEQFSHAGTTPFLYT
jgi:hypothetical protein